MTFKITKNKISTLIVKLILVLCIIQFTTVAHELGHALPLLCLTDSHVTLLLGSTNLNSGVVLSLWERFDIEIGGLLPGVGMVRWDGNNRLSLFQKSITYIGGPATSLLIFMILHIYTKRVERAKQSFSVVFTMNYALCGFLITIVPIIYPQMWLGYAGLPSDGYQLLILMTTLI